MTNSHSKTITINEQKIITTNHIKGMTNNHSKTITINHCKRMTNNHSKTISINPTRTITQGKTIPARINQSKPLPDSDRKPSEIFMEQIPQLLNIDAGIGRGKARRQFNNSGHVKGHIAGPRGDVFRSPRRVAWKNKPTKEKHIKIRGKTYEITNRQTWAR